MEAEFNYVKICIRSLLTSSPKPLSIEQLQKDYREQEGKNIPYKNLGFHSIFDLLQNMNDILTVPSNPNLNSILFLVVGEKTSHLRMLVKKQKSNSKRKKGNSYKAGSYRNHNGKNTFPIINFNRNTLSYNKNLKNDSYKNYQFQNSRNDYHKEIRFSNYHPRNQQFSSNNRSSDIDKYHLNQNGLHCVSYNTNYLQAELEKYISENKMLISVDKFEELVRSHPQFSFLKTKDMQDVINQVKHFFNVNELGVSLKSNSNFSSQENIPLIYQIADKTSQSSNLSNNDRLLNNHSLHSTSSLKNNSTNNSNAELVSSNDQCNDKNLMTDLLEQLKLEYLSSQSSQYMESFNHTNMVSKLQDIQVKDKNSVEAKINLKNNIAFVKRQTEIRQSKENETVCSNQSCFSDFVTDSENNFSNHSKTPISHSTPNQNKNYVIENINIFKENQSIPREVLINIARIFKVYDGGVNIQNFKFIYSLMNYTIFDVTSYGFTSIIQMFKVLDQMIEIRKNVLYGIGYSTIYKNINFKNYINLPTQVQETIIQGVLSNNNLKIVLQVEQQTFESERSKPMILVEAYNPSFFFLQLAYKTKELEQLMDQMKLFYNVESTKYCVQPEQIVLGSVYAFSYSAFTILKQWRRVRILREVDSTTVQIIHVDFGTVNNIPKTELKFLKEEFGSLPCQAIYCCLTGYNELDTISPEVTNAFVEYIRDKQIMVKVDKHFILDKHCQIFHVTLFKKNIPKTNVNYELTKWHLNHD